MDIAENIFIINLPHHTERWNEVSKEIKKYNIKAKKFDGILGKNLSYKEIEDKTSWTCRKLICNYGTIGCFLSHLSLWKKLIQDNENNFYLIFEDDFKIHNFENVSKLYSLFKCKAINPKVDYLSLYTNTWDISTGNREEYDGIEICKKIYPNTTLGYFITKDGAKKFVEKIGDKVRYHVDLYLAFLDKTNKDINIYNTLNNLIGRNDLGYQTSSINTSPVKKTTLLSYLLPPKFYFELKFPLIVIDLKTTFTLEFFLSILLSIIFIRLGLKKRNVLFGFIGLFFLINAGMSFFSK